MDMDKNSISDLEDHKKISQCIVKGGKKKQVLANILKKEKNIQNQACSVRNKISIRYQQSDIQ